MFTVVITVRNNSTSNQVKVYEVDIRKSYCVVQQEAQLLLAGWFPCDVILQGDFLLSHCIVQVDTTLQGVELPYETVRDA